MSNEGKTQCGSVKAFSLQVASNTFDLYTYTGEIRVAISRDADMKQPLITLTGEISRKSDLFFHVSLTAEQARQLAEILGSI